MEYQSTLIRYSSVCTMYNICYILLRSKAYLRPEMVIIHFGVQQARVTKNKALLPEPQSLVLHDDNPELLRWQLAQCVYYW